MSYDKFYATVWKQGNSLIITVPANIIKGARYKEGQKLVVMIKKESEKVEWMSYLDRRVEEILKIMGVKDIDEGLKKLEEMEDQNERITSNET